MKSSLVSLIFAALGTSVVAGGMDACSEENPCSGFSGSSQSMTLPSLVEENTRALFRFKLAIPTTPEGVQNAELFDEDGNRIHFRFFPEPRSRFILGTPDRNLTFDFSKSIEDRGTWRFIISGRDRLGNSVPLDQENVHIETLNNEDVCFDVENLENTDVEVLVGIAVDRSSSMGRAIGDVQASLKDFLERMPEKAMCRVLPFNKQLTDLTPQGLVPFLGDEAEGFRCKSLATNNISSIEQRGGTKISPPLSVLYRRALRNPKALNLVVAISDGLGDQNDLKQLRYVTLPLRNQAKANQTHTFINWLGSHQGNAVLKDLADGEMIGRIEGRPFASDFFQAIEEQVVGQHIVTIPCKK